MKSLLLTAALVFAAALIPVTAAPQSNPVPATCANQGYVSSKVFLCQLICESPGRFTDAQRNVYIKKWMYLYRDLPYCLLAV